MKEEDNFNFDDDFDSSAEESPKESKQEADMLPGDEFAMEESEEELPKAKAGLMDFIKANWLIIVIGGVGAAVAGYLTYGILFPSAPPRPAVQVQQSQGFGLKPVVPEPSKAASTSQTPASTPSQASTIANPAMQTTAPAGSSQNPAASQMMTTAPVTPTITMTQQDIKTLLQGFAKVVNESTQNIYSQMQNLQVLIQDVGQASLAQQKQNTQIINALSNMQQSMQTLANSLNTYNKNMQNISLQLGKTQQQLALLLAEQSAQVQKLTLRAVVPGRAWLVDDEGNTTTVTVGTQLPNYGTVVNIDSGKGEVVMSTGYVFK
ncbi:MAG: hypothetical protein K0S29_7 [Gammaproteobacteria bacterium]|jgi:hypothetical protein|nr:hypothetical protein [Gammaproteobacteria bacterium]